MCCFSNDVRVTNTRIFARPGREGRQFLVYSMSIDSEEEGAMVLPLPVPPGSPDDALRFINFEGYPKFFDDVKKAFPQPRVLAAGSVEAKSWAAALAVVEVGAFEASFVPSAADFERLDPRFRLPDGTWDDLPGVADFGFAVFKLKAGRQDVHPMAFEFPRRDPRSLFFPTLHVHDGSVHAKADFDHSLYCQPNQLSLRELMNWQESTGPASRSVKLDKTQGVVDGEQHLYTRDLRGMLKNQDTVLREERS